MNLSTSYRFLVSVLLVAISSLSVAQAVPSASPLDAVKLHEKLLGRGIGKSVKVTETDGTVVAGTLVAVGPESFDVMRKHETAPIRIRNEQVANVGRSGLSTGLKVTLIVVVVMVLLGATVGTRV